jgi:hypothetical protein
MWPVRHRRRTEVNAANSFPLWLLLRLCFYRSAQAQNDGTAATRDPIVVEIHFLTDPYALYTFTLEENQHVDFE